MREYMMGINQSAAQKYGLGFDHQAILRWLLDWIHYGNMSKKDVGGKTYYWVRWQTVIDELPALGVESKDSIKRRFEHMADAGVLLYHHDQQGGRRTYYHPDKKAMKELLPSGQESDPSGNTATRDSAEVPEGIAQKRPIKDCAVKDGAKQEEERPGGPLSREARLKTVAEDPHLEMELTPEDRQEMQEIIDHHCEVWSMAEPRMTNKLTARLCDQLLHSGKERIIDAINKANRLAAEHDYWGGCRSFATLLSKDKFEEVMDQDMPGGASSHDDPDVVWGTAENPADIVNGVPCFPGTEDPIPEDRLAFS